MSPENDARSEAASSPASAMPAEEASGYRELNRWAIVALVLALASPLALVHPVVWLVPMASILLSLTALRSIARSEGTSTGRVWAGVALVIATLFAAWGVSQVALRQWVLASQARAVADHWLELLEEGKLQEAHQLTLSLPERETRDTNLEKYYQSSEVLSQSLEGYFTIEPFSWLKALDDDDASFQFVSQVRHTQESLSEDAFTLAYDLILPVEGGTRTRRVHIVVKRQVLEPIDVVSWRVVDALDPNRRGL